ncbi:MAG: cobalt transporter [Parvularcula sp.]|nr:cobalt transporter [Parvularcula sp.]
MTENAVRDRPAYPQTVETALEDAERIEWITLFWLAVIVAVMGWAMGGSQAFKTAWIEDVLSLLAPASFLVARRFEKKPPSEGFPYGYHRAASLAFFFSSAALFVIGAWLLYDGAMSLMKAEHPTIGSRVYFGTQIWSGWIMIGALIFSVIPPVILGRRKLGIAKKLHDKVLYVDAQTNSADWQTGLASIAGIVGIGFGFRWADAAMAVLISLSIIKDGYGALKKATISLLDGMPRALDSHAISEDARLLKSRLESHFPGTNVQIRETGRFFRASVEPEGKRVLPPGLRREYLSEDDWRLIEVTTALRDVADRKKPDQS